MSTTAFSIALIVMILGGIYGWRRGSRKLEAKIQAEAEEFKPKRRRANVSDDAPQELSEAELLAMGTWFKE